mmetsp:Transcript_3966/g.12403  ORF Transcript_3966/g.12403 Transcript_3966/m.12403 type:complete len:317 (-) Transcript_3966:3376-4326(-)
MPSQQDMNSFLSLRVASCSLLLCVRLLSMESTSSMKTMHGAIFAASVKSAFTHFSPSPNHFDAMLDMVTEMKLAPASVATAFASSVLPVPGGPKSSTPLQGCVRLPRLKSSGRLSGSITSSLSVSLTESSEPMSSKRTPTSSAAITSLIRRFSKSLSSATSRSLPLAPPADSARAFFSSATASLMHAAGSVSTGRAASGSSGVACNSAASASAEDAAPTASKAFPLPLAAARPTEAETSAACSPSSPTLPPPAATSSPASPPLPAPSAAASLFLILSTPSACTCFESAQESTRSASAASMGTPVSLMAVRSSHSRR